MLPDERRQSSRYEDGTVTQLRAPEGTAAVAHILDICSDGARIWSPVKLPTRERVTCALPFAIKEKHVGLRLVWRRFHKGGYEYGAVHAPAVPGSETTMDNYVLSVLARREVC